MWPQPQIKKLHSFTGYIGCAPILALADKVHTRINDQT